MARQISFDDMIPDELKRKVVGFASEQFQRLADAEELPNIKNRHESYGLLAEAFVSVKGAAASVKSAVDDALNALPASDDAFREAADISYSACISTAQAAINMAVQAQNISLQYLHRHREQPLHLLEGLEGDEEMDEIPEIGMNDDTEENEHE